MIVKPENPADKEASDPPR